MMRTPAKLACLTTSALLFAALVAGVLFGLSDGFDTAIRSAVNGWATPELTSAFSAITWIGAGEVVYALTAVVTVALLAIGRRSDALYLLAVMAAAFLINNAVKYSVARARPEAFFGETPTTYSFASGHALYASCFYAVVGALIAGQLPGAWPRAVLLLGVLALVGAIGLSRVYLGVHYPTDVLAGFALAALILCVARGLATERQNAQT